MIIVVVIIVIWYKLTGATMVTIELEGSCRTLDDCQDFIADVARNREGLPYVPGSVQCVRPSMAGLGNSTLSGCAVVRPLAPLTAPVLWCNVAD